MDGCAWLVRFYFRRKEVRVKPNSRWFALPLLEHALKRERGKKSRLHTEPKGSTLRPVKSLQRIVGVKRDENVVAAADTEHNGT